MAAAKKPKKVLVRFGGHPMRSVLKAVWNKAEREPTLQYAHEAVYNIPFNSAGLKALMRRGFTVGELADLFKVSRPTVYRLAEGKTLKLHPGIEQYINSRIEELLFTTGV